MASTHAAGRQQPCYVGDMLLCCKPGIMPGQLLHQHMQGCVTHNLGGTSSQRQPNLLLPPWCATAAVPQDIINEVNTLAHQAKAKLEQVDRLNTAAQQKKGQGVGSASERTRTSITSGTSSCQLNFGLSHGHELGDGTSSVFSRGQGAICAASATVLPVFDRRSLAKHKTHSRALPRGCL